LILERSDISDVLRRNVLPNLDVITTGTLPRNPSELLLSPKIAQLLEEWSRSYDMVVLDTAPVLTMSDPMALAPHVGTLFLLARAEVTTLAELDESARRLARAGGRVNGVIFND